MPYILPWAILNGQDLDAVPVQENFEALLAAVNSVEAGGAYEHIQASPATTWTIVHNLGTHPAGAVVYDSAGTQVFGMMQYVDSNTVQLVFTNPFSGRAYLV